VLAPGAEITADQVRALLRERISTYKVPRHLALFASPDELPWLDSGKIDRVALDGRLRRRFAVNSLRPGLHLLEVDQHGVPVGSYRSNGGRAREDGHPGAA